MRFVVLFVSLLLCLSGEAFAENCDQALILSTYSSIKTSHLDWRLASFVSDETWTTIQHQGGASAVIYGIPVGASYSDFKNNVSKYSSSYNESLGQDEFENVAWTGLDPNAATAYGDCIKLQIANKSGLHLSVVAADATNIILRAEFTVPGARDVKVQWQPSGIIPDQKLYPGQTNFSIARPGAAISLAANVNYQHANYASEVVRITPLPTAPKRNLECIVDASFAGLAVGAPKSFICKNMDAGATVAADFTSGSGMGIDGGGTWLEGTFYIEGGGSSFPVNLAWAGQGARPTSYMPVTGTATGIVPLNGIVQVTFRCARADWTDSDWHRSTCNSRPGTKVRIHTDLGNVLRVKAERMKGHS